jgi:hypothetical protein
MLIGVFESVDELPNKIFSATLLSLYYLNICTVVDISAYR